MKPAIYVLTLAAAMLANPAFAQEQPTTVQRAVKAVPVLQAKMNDPDSFQLISVHTATEKGIKCDGKWCKHKEHFTFTNVCFIFRAHNAMGGYGSPNVAVLVSENEDDAMKGDSGKLLIIGTEEEAESGGLAGVGWHGACQSRKFDQDITGDVKASK